MKTFITTLVALLVLCLAAELGAAHAAQPDIRPLLSGAWRAPETIKDDVIKVEVAGNYAYLALGPGGLAVIDVSDPSTPVRVGGVDTGSGLTQDVAVSGCYAYVTDTGAGLRVIDVSNPTHCIAVGGYGNTFAEAVAISGDYAYLAGWGGLQVIDVSNPTNCVLVGGRVIGLATDVVISGRYAYVTDSGVGLQVIDVSDPANCVQVGGYQTFRGPLCVTVSGNYAYVSSYEPFPPHGALEVIDVSNPTNCVRVGYYRGGYGWGVALSGNYAYLAAGGLSILDVSNPTMPMHVGGYTAPGGFGVAVAAGRVYVAVAGGNAGLLVLPSLPNVQFSLRVDATPGVPFTLEAATNLSLTNAWTPLLTTNVPSMPFDFVDFDVKLSDKPQKYYRVRQP